MALVRAGVASCSVSQRPPALPLLHQLETVVKKQDFQMLTPESRTGARRRDCFSDRLAYSFSVSLLYTKRTVLMHH